MNEVASPARFSFDAAGAFKQSPASPPLAERAARSDRASDSDVTTAGASSDVQSVPISALKPGAWLPRTEFDEDALNGLADSIRERGMLQPILARRIEGKPGQYEIIAGERRWRAAQQAGLTAAPVMLRELSDRDAGEISLIENVQREDLNPIEEANGYLNLVESFAYTHADLAKTVGKSRPHIANTLRLLQLTDPVRKLLAEGKITAGHGRALLGASDQQQLASVVIDRGLNVRQTERLAQEGSAPVDRSAAPTARDPNIQAVERSIAQSLGLKARLRPKTDSSGRLTLDYKDKAQLEQVLLRLTGVAETDRV